MPFLRSVQVVAVQVKSIQDAIRDKKQRFNFMGTDISLNPNVGLFITMVRSPCASH